MTLQDSVGEFDTLEKLRKKALGLNFTEVFYRYKHIFKTKVLKHKDTLEEDKSYALSSEYNPDFIIGADLMLKKSALEKTGVFNERFFMFGEEAELCFRLKKNGFKIKFVPESIIIHFGGASASKANNQLKVEKMVLEGTILFFNLCYGEKVAREAKLLYILYYLRYLPMRFFAPKAFFRLKMAWNIKILTISLINSSRELA